MKEIPGVTQRAVDLIVPYEQQYDGSCGPASLRIAYLALGKDVPEDQLVKELDCDDDGTDWDEMLKNPRKHGFGVWEVRNATFDNLVSVHDVTGFPIIVDWFSNRGEGKPDDHYSVIKRINPKSILLADPGIGDLYPMTRDEFIKRWDSNETPYSFMVIVPQI